MHKDLFIRVKMYLTQILKEDKAVDRQKRVRRGYNTDKTNKISIIICQAAIESYV